MRKWAPLALMLIWAALIGLGLGLVMSPESVQWHLVYPQPWWGDDDFRKCGPVIVGGVCDTWTGAPH